MANLAGLSPSRVELDAFGAVLGSLCERLGMDAAWASYRDDDDVVVAVSTGAAAEFNSGVGSRVSWETAMSAGPRDECGHPLEQRWQGDTNRGQKENLLTGSFVFSVARSGAGSTPVGFVSFVSRTLQPEPDPKTLAETTAVASLFAQVLAPAAEADLRRRQIHRRISDEISNDGLHVLFQPVADARTGRVVGAEGLARFSCPPAAPDVWFRDAASVGLGVDLELTAVRAALDGLVAMPGDCYLAVNVSPEVYLHPDLRDVLTGSVPSRVVLELTEHEAIHDYDAMIAKAREYRDLGCRLAVDDVGAGFASFAHVLNIEPDLVKIDLALTRGIDRDLARCTVVRAIVDVADRIGAAVVAEGVESQDELDVIAALGVKYAQGFFLAKPAPLPLPAATACSRTNGFTRPLIDIDSDSTARTRFELALRHSPIGMAIVSLEGRVLHSNEAMAAMLGYDESALARKTYQELTHPDDLDEDVVLARECRDGLRESYRIEKRYVTATGAVVWADLSVVVVRSDENAPLYFVSQIQDITERRQREHSLAQRAATDSLTGLATRDAVSERIQYLLDHHRTFGIVFCGMDNLKEISDRHGAGDQVLVAVAERIRSAVRNSDTVARWDGDHFIAIVAADHRSLQRTAERITDTVAQPLTIQPEGHTYTPMISTGTTSHSAIHDTTPTELIRLADQAMYHRRRSTQPR